MKEIKILLVLFILPYFSLYGQNYIGYNTSCGFEKIIKFQINNDSIVSITYDDGSHYAEYDGTIRQLNDTTYHISSKEIINKSGMEAFPDDTSIGFRLDTTILNNLSEISIIYSDNTTIDCFSYYNKERDYFEIPINSNLYNDSSGEDFYYLTFDHNNRITGNILKFKVEYGSDLALYTGENTDFKIVISGDYLYSVDHINSVLGRLKLKKIDN